MHASCGFSRMLKRRWLTLAVLVVSLNAACRVGIAPMLPTPPQPRSTRLAVDLTLAAEPSWSPDGMQIAFRGSQGYGDEQIYVMTLGDNAARRVTDLPGISGSPAWSPHGDLIAFVNFPDRFAAGGLYVVTTSGAGLRLLTDQVSGVLAPAWSPDGGRIVFAVEQNSRSQIYLVDADGSNLRQVTAGAYSNTEPVWFPDGQRILFSSDRSGKSVLYEMRIDGSDQRLFSGRTLEGHSATWSPDGQRIVFESDAQLWLMRADGSGLKSITPVGYTQPAWSPRGQQLATTGATSNGFAILLIDVEP